MGIIQNAINQMFGTAAVATRLGPKYAEMEAEKAGEKQFKTEKALREQAAASHVEAANLAEKELTAAEPTIAKGTAGHKQIQSVIELNEKAQNAQRRALLYNPTKEGQAKLKQLETARDELEQRRQAALKKTAKQQETKRKLKESHEAFKSYFVTTDLEHEFKQLRGNKLNDK